MNLRSLFLFFSILPAFCMVSTAQNLKVVKDNIACAYGIKNAAGNWVVPARYTLIEQTKTGEFVVTDGNRKGLWDARGKQILPTKYSEIDRFGAPWGRIYSHQSQIYKFPGSWRIEHPLFLVKKGDKYGLASHTGTLVFPVSYSNIKSDMCPNLVLYKWDKGGMTYFSTYVDTSGKILIPEQEGYMFPFGRDSLSLIGTRYAGRGVIGECGMMNKQGKMVIPKEYDQMEFCSGDLISVEKGGKQGMINRKGEIIIPTTYKVLLPSMYDRQLPCMSNDYLWRIREGDAFGLMTGLGEVVAEPVYDLLKKPYPSQTTDNYGWNIRRNGKWGTLTKMGKPALDTAFDTLRPIPHRGGRSRSTGPVHTHFVFGKNGKYGLITPLGEVLEEAVYDTFFFARYQENLWVFFPEGRELNAYKTSVQPAQKVPTTIINQYDSLLLYKVENLLMPFSFSPKDPKQLVGSGYRGFHIQNYGKLTVLQKNYGNPATSQCFIFTQDGELWGGVPMHRLGPAGNTQWKELATKSGKKGLLNPHLGEIVFDTLYAGFKMQWNDMNNIWARLWMDANSPPAYKCGAWVLLDSMGNRQLEQVFDRPFTPDDTAKATSNGKMGIYDFPNRQWLLPPTYEYFRSLSPNSTLVYTADWKVGIMDENYTLFVDTIYNHVEELYSSHRAFRPKKSGWAHPEKWWRLMNEQDTVLISNRNERITTPAARLKKSMELAFQDTLKSDQNHCSLCFRIYMDPEVEEVFQKSNLQSEVYTQALRFHRRYNVRPRPTLNPTPCVDYPGGWYNRNERSFSLQYLCESAYTLDIMDQSPVYDMEMPAGYETRHLRLNRVWVDGEWKTLELEDITGTGRFLENELVRAIKARDDLDLNCSSPSGLVADLHGQFEFSKEGLVVILQQERYNWNQHRIVIPWERVLRRPGTEKIVALIRS